MEIWKDIKGYEGHYQVSNLGRVKSIKFNKDKIIKEFVSGKNPYLQVSLCMNSKQKSFTVHKLVASSFLDHKSEGQNKDGDAIIIDHINKNKLDNRLENLRELSFRKNISGKRPGVYETKNSKFQVRIQFDKKRIHLGTFDNVEDANSAYDYASLTKDISKFNKKIINN